MRILVVDDQHAICHSMKKSLGKLGHKVATLEDGCLVVETLLTTSFDLIFLDIKLGQENGIDILKQIKRMPSIGQVPVILMTAYNETDIAIESIKYGAADYILKPFDINDIENILLEVAKSNDDAAHSVCIENDGSFCKQALVGRSTPFVNILKEIGKIACNSIPVLILGETGTGKDMVGKAIHKFSNRSDKPYVAINCSSIPRDLLEAELFGYKKGAFTGAASDHMGKVELADNGILFLDEIGDMHPDLQAKLLRLLQEGSFYPVGGNELKTVNVRFIAATHQNIQQLVKRKEFREDLFFRLSGYTINIPPLRERIDDIEPLVIHFIQKYAEKPIHIAPESIEKLQQYRYPGNVRELENIMRRALLESSNNIISERNICFNKSEISELYETSISSFETTVDMSSGDGIIPLQKVTKNFQKIYVSNVFSQYDKNQLQAAAALKISRNTLRKILDL
ncbi:putative two component, sigma54 specific, transcriptional regulator, Fis family [Denitrovibrio acetiphilus DSM 12809]|jgi:two-component system nitrogen regulation response regulator GlnG|uniref:DNA-binding transcriptional regulator NtrC n=1 Tax=Denitrovibrio acetiphilus (strain DSM 12809 / NBRC 114555 / N2460) TaxID=522772 RepID=D4H4X6_DENA2|nr:sigma-54 dependent transcriptional regulator [Denitrovibrio acetiphilus]ADD69332.1 putative two component, sigma54 specific, transcriptional regulator, Fis family [Denitrovibrio acetiphilus DSM 12809]